MVEKNKTKSTENIAKIEEMVYTISEVATLLKVNRNFVYTLISNGYLRSIKLGCRKVTRTSLLEFLNKYDGIEDFNEKYLQTPLITAFEGKNVGKNFLWANGGQN